MYLCVCVCVLLYNVRVTEYTIAQPHTTVELCENTHIIHTRIPTHLHRHLHTQRALWCRMYERKCLQLPTYLLDRQHAGYINMCHRAGTYQMRDTNRRLNVGQITVKRWLTVNYQWLTVGLSSSRRRQTSAIHLTVQIVYTHVPIELGIVAWRVRDKSYSKTAQLMS